MGFKTGLKKLVVPSIHLEVKHTNDSNLLAGRTAVITGGGSGIGLAIAEKIVMSGGNVVLVGRDEEKLKGAFKRLETSSYKGGIVVCDVRDYRQCIELPEKVLAFPEINQVDIVVNSAGTNGRVKNFFEVDEEEWNLISDTNLKATYFITQSFIRYFIINKQKGHIHNICSVTGMKGSVLPYGISKWGVIGMTEGLGKRFAKDGIIINGIAPGATATAMVGFDEGGEGDLAWIAPSGRYSSSEEIANLAVFMCSDMGDNMVGSVIPYDGGERFI